MEADSRGWLRLIKTKGRHSFFDIVPQLFPIVTLGEDGVSEAFCNKAAVAFLGNLKYDLAHAVSLG